MPQSDAYLFDKIFTSQLATDVLKRVSRAGGPPCSSHTHGPHSAPRSLTVCLSWVIPGSSVEQVVV